MQEFKKIGNRPYKLKTENGIEEIQWDKALDRIEESFGSEGDEFGKMSEKFIFSYLCKVKDKNLSNEKDIWNQMVFESS